MLTTLPAYCQYLLSFALAALVGVYAVRKIIFITAKRKIFDIPDNIRKIHGEQIPSLGGIGIFIGYMAIAPFFVPLNFSGWNYIIISSVILFFTGVYDDIMNMRPSKKLLAQLAATAITVYFADIRITSLYGTFGIHELPFPVSVLLTTFCGTFFINVFNFIDGIDGLACMMSLLYTTLFGLLMAFSNETATACIAFSLTGATAGLLFFNYPPAKIYMGDTGSMLLGFSIFLLSLLFIRSSASHIIYHIHDAFGGQSALRLVIAVFFLPVFDALRVFVLRAVKGISPLKADRRHLHYYLLDAGISHAVITWLFAAVNCSSIFLCLLFINSPIWLVMAFMALPSALLATGAGILQRKAGV
ncbi:MAG: undecaprenyl/decaprenyl-phosphate alpha-N-acetylglucosaminyl 1-phosphate transferase [Taibaiella sp.]|nr:undecaprenyl/decaprenyl-phosphate alpha-N-acetylglucosaminyl 1-phosphate transferase [Taibaiella sp.]